MSYIPISYIQEFAYCPRNAWHRSRALPGPETADLVEGALLHERSDSSVRTVVDGVVQTRTVFLYSDALGLTGIADLVEERKREIYPVEYKKGRDGDWKPHQLQLCAQAICLEEMLQLPRKIRKAYLFYAAAGTRRTVRLGRSLRSATLSAIKALRAMLEEEKPPKVRYGPKCFNCSLNAVCLLQETETMRKQKLQKLL